MSNTLTSLRLAYDGLKPNSADAATSQTCGLCGTGLVMIQTYATLPAKVCLMTLPKRVLAHDADISTRCRLFAAFQDATPKSARGGVY